MTSNISLISDFNEEAIIQYLNVSPNAKGERTAIRFLYKTIREQMVAENDHSPPSPKAVIDDVIGGLTFRYDLYSGQISDYFPKRYQPDYEALGIAVICGALTRLANGPLPGSGDPNIPMNFRDDGFNEAVLFRAVKIFNDAEDLLRPSPVGNISKYKHESYCLAHIHAFDWLNIIDETFDVIDDVSLGTFLRDRVPAIQRLLRPTTELGLDLYEALENITDRIRYRIFGVWPVANDEPGLILLMPPGPR